MRSIYVLGSLNMDLAIYGNKYPDAGETLKGHGFRTGAGGKGLNQAVAASRLGGNVHFLGAIGKDAFGAQMKETLSKAGVDVSHVAERSNVSSGVALIEVVNGENRIMIDSGANETISEAEVDDFLSLSQPGDIFLTQGENNFEAASYAIKKAHEKKLVVVVNPAPADKRIVKETRNIDIITPNETEFAALTGSKDYAKKGYLLDTPILIVTLGKAGSFVSTAGGSFIEPAVKVNVVDTTGAGDAYCGALVYFLSANEDIKNAVRLAGHYASLKTTKKGTAVAMPTSDEFSLFEKTLI
jgi:ribokinase